MCLRVCPRSRPPHRKKNYIKFLVRDFVNPLDVAWSTLKKMYGRPLGPHPETGLDMGLPWPMGHIGAPPGASVDHPDYRGRKPSPPSPPVPETANPLPENQPYEHLPDEAFMRRDEREQMRRQAAVKEAMDRLLAETPGTELSQRELDEQRRAEEAMYPNPEQWLGER